MFDVAWKKTASETVAQRRRRKELEQQKTPRDGRRRSMQSASSSSASLKAQGSPRTALFGLFGSPKKPKNTETASKAEDWTPMPSRLSCHEIPSLLEEDPVSPISSTQACQTTDVRDKESFLDNVQYSPTSNAESTFSRWPGRSDATESSMSSITDYGFKSRDNRPLSTSSFAIVNTFDATCPLSGAADVSSTTSDTPSAEDQTEGKSSIAINDLSIFPKVPKQVPIRLKPGTELHARAQTAQAESSPRSKPQKLWEAPEACVLIPNELVTSTHISPVPNSQNEHRAPRTKLSETAHMQRHIRRMRAASPKIILERIREQWTNIADATIYRELEFEKQLWMLTGLKFLERNIGNKRNAYNYNNMQLAASSKPSQAPKVLSLYENQACASFLATYSQTDDFHHLTTAPITSPVGIPQIQPMTPMGPYVALPYATSIFASVHSLTLPVILPSPSIPALLRECHRVLSPDGTLHLTIMDPSPVVSTSGPCLRRWLDNNLLLNLETQFLCTTPSRLLPVWLQDAGFSREPPPSGLATLTKIRFWAVGRGEGGFADATDSNDAAKEMSQLTAVVGRTLWREIWGKFVVGDKWWWEDEEIVDECARLGTRWDCSVMSAVKRVK